MYRTSKWSASAFILPSLLALSPARGADIVTHLFPHKDGEVANTGGNADSLLLVEEGESVGWIIYQTGGTDLSQTAGSSLTLYVDSLLASGTLKVFALEQAVTDPELDVDGTDLDYDDLSPVATIALTGSHQEKILRLDLDTLLGSGTFHGLVLRGYDGLHAEFGSKDSHLQPLIELRAPFATPAQVEAAIAAATVAESAAENAGAAATAAAGSATAAAASATAAAGSATAAAASETASATSATSASGSASSASSAAYAASSSATAAAASATSASGSASSASASATAASSSASAAASSADEAEAHVPPGTAILFTLSATPPAGFSSTGFRINREFPWSAKASLTSARHSSAADTLNGKIYLAGGYTTGTSAVFQSYDPATNAWTNLTAMPAAREALTITELGGYLYAVGGRNATTVTTSVYKYDPGANTWSTMTSLSTGRFGHGAVAYGGKVHIFGGSTTYAGAMTSSHEVYDPATNTWSSGTAMPAARSNFSVSKIDTLLYFVGGATAPGTYTSLNDIFNINTNAWSNGAALNQVRSVHSSVVANGMIYIFGGYRTAFLTECEQYDPVANTWTPTVPLTFPRAYVGAAYTNGKAYLFGGQAGSTPFATVEAYDIPTTLFGILKN